MIRFQKPCLTLQYSAAKLDSFRQLSSYRCSEQVHWNSRRHKTARAHGRKSVDQNLEWGRQCKLSLRFCHNTPKHVISVQGLGLSHIIPFLPTKPLESAPSSPGISSRFASLFVQFTSSRDRLLFVVFRLFGHNLGHRYGPGTGPVWLGYLRCNGSETDIRDCENYGWGLGRCEHDRDVSIRCTNISSGTTRLCDDLSCLQLDYMSRLFYLFAVSYTHLTLPTIYSV